MKTPDEMKAERDLEFAAIIFQRARERFIANPSDANGESLERKRKQLRFYAIHYARITT